MLKISKQQEWFHCIKPIMSPKLRLFCFPYAGGGGSIFREWEKGLPSGVELHTAQLPGREKRFIESPYRSMEELVQEMSEVFGSLRGIPFAFYGHSMGALIAFELACKLYQRYGEMPVHLFLSGKGAPQLEANKLPVYNLPQKEFMEKLICLNGTPREILENRELMELYEPILRADFEVCDTYSYQKGMHLKCPISVFGGLQDIVSKEDLEAWGEVTNENVRVFMFEGDHFFIFQKRDEILHYISKEL
ncbi:thioesterase II family protein [Bacillus cereus group sp. BfR-BA-01446]|uniref:thioesterase II family protein n=1 Tax=Bacillus cereus group sp. BfR-BA-01446 TaxID=2920350 RepID=UPI001F5A3079|nr:thioesterase domain-containing protein [Bacillus cereus group sp. BfR-BA-01446]